MLYFLRQSDLLRVEGKGLLSEASNANPFSAKSFGVMGWVEAGYYEHAAPDPLAEAAPGILDHLNADHVDSMILLARSYAQMGQLRQA